jgi:hypothetical protein
MSVRKEVSEFTRSCDILLNGVSSELTQTELELIKAYTERMREKLGLEAVQSTDSLLI